MIDIIIPAYNAHKTIEKTLCSIAIQDCIDKINVYIIDDCSEKNYNEIVDFFANFFTIKVFRLEKNSGPGVSRQYGIEHSNSEFIMFIDADDVLMNCYSIKNLYNKIYNENSDVVIGSFIEEVPNGFKSYNDSYIWLHGKMYRRSFIENNKIHFNNSRYNEDNGFNQLLFLCNPNISKLDVDVYIWRNYSESITRKNNYEFNYKGLEDYIYNMNWAMEKALDRNYDRKFFSLFAFSVLVSEYHSYLQFFEIDDLRKKIIKMSKKTLYYSNLYPVDEQEKYKILRDQFEYTIDDVNSRYLLNPSITFNCFLNIVGNEVDVDC